MDTQLKRSLRANALAFASGQRAFERTGTSPELVRAIRLSIENDRKLAAHATPRA